MGWSPMIRFLPLVGLGAAVAALSSGGCSEKDERLQEGLDAGGPKPDADTTTENRPPECGTNEDRYIEEGQTLSFPFRATDPNGDHLIYSSAGLPRGASLDSSGLFTWKPEPGQVGEYTVPFEASDGQAVANCEVTIHVSQKEPTEEFPPTCENEEEITDDFFIERVSIGSAGEQGNGWSDFPSISDCGRYVAFRSEASNLVPADTNGVHDVFVRDRITGTTIRVSEGTGEIQGNDYSGQPFISGNGRFVSFYSRATNLVEPPTLGYSHVYVKDLLSGALTLASVGDEGRADGSSGSPIIFNNSPMTYDGSAVAFYSEATNLSPLGVEEDFVWPDIFVRDLENGVTIFASAVSGELPGHYYDEAAISGDGRFVAFTQYHNSPPPGVPSRRVLVRDRSLATTELISRNMAGASAEGFSPAISADGRFVTFTSQAPNIVPDDTNGEWDVFVYDREVATMERVSVSSDEEQANGTSNGDASASISADGRFVAFGSWASNLVPGDTNGGADVFVRDREAGTTVRVSLGPGGVQINGGCDTPSLSPDGRFVAFQCSDQPFVSGDTNSAPDVFVVGLDYFFSP